MLAVAAASLFLGIATSGTSSAVICVVPDDGSGTASFPPDTSAPGCTTGYASVGHMAMIIDGLPPGQMIAGTAEYEGFLVTRRTLYVFRDLAIDLRSAAAASAWSSASPQACTCR